MSNNNDGHTTLPQIWVDIHIHTKGQTTKNGNASNDDDRHHTITSLNEIDGEKQRERENGNDILVFSNKHFGNELAKPI